MQLPTMPSFSLRGRTALVVGASSGIGTACAVALAEYGATVTIGQDANDKSRMVLSADSLDLIVSINQSWYSDSLKK